MKRGTVILIFLLLAVSLLQFSLAQEEGSGNESDNGNITQATEEAKEATSKATSRVSQITDPFIETKIEFPRQLNFMYDLFLGFGKSASGESVNVAKFIIAVMIWILALLMFHNAVTMFSAFSNQTNIAIAALMAVFMSALGVIDFFSDIFLGIGEGIGGLREWSAGQLLVAVVVVGLLIFILVKVSEYQKRHDRLTEAREKGSKVGAKIAESAAMADAAAEIGAAVEKNK